MSAPLCINGHGVMERRAVEQRIYDDGSEKVLSAWACRACPYHTYRPATEAEEISAVCDFCSRPGPTKEYPCRSFSYVMVGFGGSKLRFQRARSVGSWLACTDCATIIDADDRPGLAKRSLDMLAGARYGSDQNALRLFGDALRQMHDEFFSHRIIDQKEVRHGTTGD